MDQDILSGELYVYSWLVHFINALSPATSVLKTLLKTNRPPTEQEEAIIVESMAPTNAKLKDIDGQISNVIAHIESLKLLVEQAENKLHCLREEQTAILDTLSDHRRVFSAFRRLPEDVLREICTTCVHGSIPELYHYRAQMPYILSQICSGMRHAAWTTPVIWASMSVNIGNMVRGRIESIEDRFAFVAQRAVEWFERTGGLPLTLTISDGSDYYLFDDSNSKADPTSILFNTLLIYSSRWKEIYFISDSPAAALSSPMRRLAVAMTAADVPQLQSVSLYFPPPVFTPGLNESGLLRVPTLRHVTLQNCIQKFTVNWAVITSITLRGDTKNYIGRTLQQTKCLVFCDIVVHPLDEHYSHQINLPFLKTLIISQGNHLESSPRAHSILGSVTAPILEILDTCIEYVDLSLPGFLKRSPSIGKLYLRYFDQDFDSLTDTMEFLRNCPCLNVFSLKALQKPWGVCDANRFLQAFVEEGTDGVICPRLQDFKFSGYFDFSAETLQKFLEGKQGDITTPNVLPWRRVVIDIFGIKVTEEYRKASDLVSRKRAAGLDVYTC